MALGQLMRGSKVGRLCCTSLLCRERYLKISILPRLEHRHLQVEYT